MRTIAFIIQKEFKQIFRDKILGRAIFIIPILQMMVLVYAATFELKYVNLLIVDKDQSSDSRALFDKFDHNPFFHVNIAQLNNAYVEDALTNGKADLIMVINDGFEKDLHREHHSEVQFLVDAVNGSSAQLGLGYCRKVLFDFNKEILIKEKLVPKSIPAGINVQTRHWYNPLLDYKIFMAPGILVILVTVIGWLLAGMNLVKEKEIGTIEQLNVTPIKKHEFLIGKMAPFLIIGLADLAFGLIIARVLFDLPFEGSLLTLFFFAFVYLIAVLGLGLFISTISSTQQQVLFVSYFFMIVFILMSGLFTSVDNMPDWAKVVNYINPLAHFSKVIRMVLLKGSTIMDIAKEIYIMLGIGIAINSMAVWKYKKTV